MFVAFKMASVAALVSVAASCEHTGASIDLPAPTRMVVQTTRGQLMTPFPAQLNAYLGPTPRYTFSVEASDGHLGWVSELDVAEAQIHAGRAMVSISNAGPAPSLSGIVQFAGEQATSGIADVLFQKGHASGSVYVNPASLNASFDGELAFACWVPVSRLPSPPASGVTSTGDPEALVADNAFATPECQSLRDSIPAATSSATRGGGGGAPLPFIQIQSPLSDGTTNVGQGPFPVTFYGGGRALDDATLAHLTARLLMRTWPEAQVIPITTQKALGTTDPMRATVMVSPATPLLDQWLSLEFGVPEMGLVTNQTFNGVWGVRLRPGSHPAVALLMFCGTSIPGEKFIVSFSEAVTIGHPEAALTVEQDGKVLDCTLNEAGRTVHEFCGTLREGPVTVSVGDAEVVGMSGQGVAAQTWTMDISQLPFVETGCRGFRPPL